MGNMYKDAITWNVFVGCNFECSYCIKSFQAQMKRQKPVIDKNGRKRGCQLCYEYEPHFHPERLTQKLPSTTGDQFIWVGSSGDISFARRDWMLGILNRIENEPDKTFFFQTKNPKWYYNYEFPQNVMLGITLETNRNFEYEKHSKAPKPTLRSNYFIDLQYPRKVITIEPIMDFDFFPLMDICMAINPERVYIGYDSRRTYLPEPDLDKTEMLIDELRLNLPNCKVKEKILRPAWDEHLREEDD